MPTLTKFCLCRLCQEPMQAGAAFRWVDATRPAFNNVRGGYGYVKVPCKRPAHVHDCLAAKRAAYLQSILADAAEAGATADQLARIRARMEETCTAA